MQQANQLEILKIEGQEELPENDKVNMVELTSRLVEAQEDSNMKELSLINLSRMSMDELPNEDRRLIDALLSSPITQLTILDLSNNTCWFAHSESWPVLFSFIQE